MNDSPLVSALQTAFPDALGIWLFGSRASGQAGPHSDLDMAILVPGYADPLKLWDVAGQLADLAGCDVDLVDLRAASTVMQYQIVTTGRRLWARDVNAGLYECFILSEKTYLNERRAALLKDIQEEGRVHGR